MGDSRTHRFLTHIYSPHTYLGSSSCSHCPFPSKLLPLPFHRRGFEPGLIGGLFWAAVSSCTALHSMPCKGWFFCRGFTVSHREGVLSWTQQEEWSRSTSMCWKLLENSISAHKCSSKLWYLPCTKGQHSTAQIPQWRQLRKLYIDFFGLICFLLSLMPHPSHIRRGGSSLLPGLDVDFGKALRCRALGSMGTQSLPRAAWHTNSVRLGCSWAPDPPHSIISSSLVTASGMDQHSHQAISLI